MLSLTERLIGTYILMLAGSWVVSCGIEVNGGSDNVPTILYVANVLRWILLLPVVAGLSTWIFLAFMKIFGELRYSSFENYRQPSLTPEELRRNEALEEERRRRYEQEKIQKEIREKRECEEFRKRQEENAIRALREKQVRSAAEATTSALDDF